MCVPEEAVEVEVAEDDDQVVRGKEERVNGHQPQQVGGGVVQGERVQTRLVVELQTKIRKDLTTMEKALTRVLLKMPMTTFTLTMQLCYTQYRRFYIFNEDQTMVLT